MINNINNQNKNIAFKGTIPKHLMEKVDLMVKSNHRWESVFGTHHTTAAAHEVENNAAQNAADVFVKALKKGDSITIAIEDRKNDKGIFASIVPRWFGLGHKITAEGETTNTLCLKILKNQKKPDGYLSVKETTKKVIEVLENLVTTKKLEI